MGRRDGSSIGVWDQDLPDDEWVVEFLRAIGSGELPQELIAATTPLVPVFRRGRPVWESELPLAALCAAWFPKLVVSGGHSVGFDAICDDLAERIRGHRLEIKGAGHESSSLDGRSMRRC